MPERSHRNLEVDLLKALGIGAVVLIHSLRDFWDPGFTASELWIGQLMRFGVPAFLAVSGFLYAVPQATWQSVGPRLRRILLPYLFASSIAIALGLWMGGLSLPPAYLVDALLGSSGDSAAVPRLGAGIVLDLLLGNALGPYYYVLVISFFVLMSPLIALLSERALTLLLVFALGAQCIFEGGFWYWNDFFWHVRNPLLWSGYFILGWWLRIHADGVTSSMEKHRGRILSSSATLFVICASVLAFESGGALPHQVIQLTAWVGVYSILLLLFMSAWGRTTRSIWLARVSDLTYTVYLFHLFVLYPIRRNVSGFIEGFDPFLLVGTAAISFAVPFFLALGLRSRWGAKTRFWIGA